MLVKGYTNTMVPADAGKSLTELLQITLRNIDLFDSVSMEGEQEQVGNTTVELSHIKTYRERFEDGLAEIAARQGWTVEQCQQVAQLRKVCPPDRIYRVRGNVRSVLSGSRPLGLIVSYRPGRQGCPAEAGIAILGFANDQLGSAAKPLGVPREALEDVTEQARQGKFQT